VYATDVKPVLVLHAVRFVFSVSAVSTTVAPTNCPAVIVPVYVPTVVNWFRVTVRVYENVLDPPLDHAIVFVPVVCSNRLVHDNDVVNFVVEVAEYPPGAPTHGPNVDCPTTDVVRAVFVIPGLYFTTVVPGHVNTDVAAGVTGAADAATGVATATAVATMTAAMNPLRRSMTTYQKKQTPKGPGERSIWCSATLRAQNGAPAEPNPGIHPQHATRPTTDEHPSAPSTPSQ
jgi:hypothetical protein